ncbi:MAG: hypothetical protein JNL88_01840 [Bacteroidia bacterium]|nr:hypothetical protein [Bacteroidia bacterium]
MRHLKILLLLGSALLLHLAASAQNAVREEVKATEFSVPVSPAFALLGADPALVSMPGVIRDFKVDWSFRSYRLSPNISIEAQPIWLLAYERDDLSKYRRAGAFMRKLSTLSVSFGTIQLDTARVMAWAAKINLFRSRDPLRDSVYISEGMAEVVNQETALKQQIADLKSGLDTIGSTYQRLQTETQIVNMEAQLIALRASSKTRIKELREMYLKSYWNTSCIDLAFGQSFSYINESLDSLKMAKRGYGAWLTGGLGVGRSMFISGLVRYLRISEFEEGQQVGINFRYGSNRFRFFTEAMYEKTETSTVNEAQEKIKLLNEGFIFAYGGDLKLNNNIVLGFSLRTVYDEHVKFVNLIPVANLACLMR